MLFVVFGVIQLVMNWTGYGPPATWNFDVFGDLWKFGLIDHLQKDFAIDAAIFQMFVPRRCSRCQAGKVASPKFLPNAALTFRLVSFLRRSFRPILTSSFLSRVFTFLAC